MRVHLLFAMALSVPIAFAACGSSDSSHFDSGGDAGGDGTTDGIAPAYALRIDPPTANATVVLGTPPSAVPFHAFAKPVSGGAEVDVTAQVQWSVDAISIATVDAKGAVTPAGPGGSANVNAAYLGAAAAAKLTVKLTGDVFGPGTNAGSKATFGGATTDPNAANKPSVEYPEEGSVLPANLPPLDLQWTAGGDSTLWRVHFTAGAFLDVTAYASTRDLVIDLPTWKLVAASAPDQPTTLVVDGVGPGNLIHTSDARNIIVTADVIDESAIYVWKNSQGRFRVIDMIAEKEFDFPSDSPLLQSNPPNCSGCHVVSRDGKRFAYVYTSSFQFGTLAFDAVTKQFKQKVIAEPVAIRGTHATFNPIESTTKPALLVSVPDANTIGVEHAQGNVRLQLIDPDTGAAIASNLQTILAGIAAPNGPASLEPDWSPAGDYVVFSGYDSSTYRVRLVADEIVSSSIMEMPVKYDAQNGFVFSAPSVLVQAPPNQDPNTAVTNLLPAVSPDGVAVAFTRANGWWSVPSGAGPMNQNGRIAIVRRSDKTVIELAGGSAGPSSKWHSTWPQWAPTMGKRYAWLAFSSQRPYGHLLTPASPENQQCSLILDQIQCKHLWVMAVDRAKLASGTIDPSSAPFWVPGQTLAAQYVSPQWTKAVIAPPK